MYIVLKRQQNEPRYCIYIKKKLKKKNKKLLMKQNMKVKKIPYFQTDWSFNAASV